MKLALLSLVAACSGSSLPNVRFADKPPVAVVDDRRDIKQPAPRAVMVDVYGYSGSVEAPLDHTLSLPRHMRARGVNSLDEVPDSTWFTNRGPLTPEQVKTGASPGESPEQFKPWKIVGGQVGGTSHGLIVEDTRGYKYLLKFDHPGFPEVETAIDIIVDRLVWAAGYNVPDDRVVYVTPGDLVGDHAVIEQTLGHYDRNDDGTYRGVVSRYLDGKPLGAPPFSGTRGDDPNDRIPHEQRRDLRGMYVVFAWLDAVDLIPGNFLDMWVADPADPNVHYVQHYAIDFGKSLGAMGAMGHDLHRGHTYRFDWGAMSRALFSVGLADQPWADRPVVKLRGVASLFDATSFDPGAWHPDIPFPPFEDADRFDGYWGAKLLAKFTREQIHAAVEAARYTDPKAVEYMTDTLYARARKSVAYWFSRVATIEHADAAGPLCFDDLAIAEGVATAAGTQYTITPYDKHGHRAGEPLVLAAASSRTCASVQAKTKDYLIYALEVRRGGASSTAYIHTVAHDGPRHVVGIWRE